MAVDNALYDTAVDIWWDESQPLSSLRTAINPARLGYLEEVLHRTKLRAAGARALDIGCGGGLLAEEVARLGFAVQGVDPAAGSIEVARAHAARSGLDISYEVAGGESLPFADGIFDLVYCCDVLEHVTDLPSVVAESARVLRPGGVYFFDTINRTAASRFLMIKLFQEWRLTAWMPANLHSYDKFIKPEELDSLLSENHLTIADTVGLAPAAAPPLLFLDLVRLQRGAISCGEFGRRTAFRVGKDKSVVYAGYAIRD